MHILWFTYPGNVNVLTSLISFGTSGIYLSFLLTVIGAGIARARGWVPEGKFTARPLGVAGDHRRRGVPAGHVRQHGRADRPVAARAALFNLDWITLVVMVIVFIVGAVLFLLVAGRPGDRRAPARRRGEAGRACGSREQHRVSDAVARERHDSPSRQAALERRGVAPGPFGKTWRFDFLLLSGRARNGVGEPERYCYGGGRDTGHGTRLQGPEKTLR